ncbi:DUF302 domain-containing protein [Haliovirga abyssi]|uniref:DUF302 domain-containing protein n=1 Tax=Haliovirga abyssi TaxID=2996794 RepID=A0AAU9DBR7_9FUSO|nr:DUF302 domain-containing protein [Haliovirga abyssi]BDU49712.1 hypothetical protein HLVA_02810 [Haliovirga abyssi]
MKYEFNKEVKGEFESVKKIVIEKLKDEGFGALYTLDMKEKFKKALNEEFRRYEILGACNPKFAKKVIDIDKNIGLLLPCNVLIEQKDEDTIYVSIVNPSAVINISGNDKIIKLAKEIAEKLERVIKNI